MPGRPSGGEQAAAARVRAGRWFSFSRWLGIVGKEFIQLRRDRLTFGMIIGIPVDPAGAVRLRDQLRSEAPADGAARRRPQRVLAQHRRGAGEQRLLPHRRRGGERGGGRPAARQRRGAVRGDDSGGLRPQAGARRAAGAAGRGRRDRPDRDRQRDRRAGQLAQSALAARPHRPARAAGGEARRVRVRRARALQPRGDHAVQHRARA